MVLKIENVEVAGDGTKTKISTNFIVNLKQKWNSQRAYYEKGGVIAALFDAIILAKESKQPPPEWVLNGALKVIGDRLKFGFKKGATGNESQKYEMAMKHYHRWQAVKKLRRKGIVWTKVFHEAEKLLAGTNDSVKHDAIKASYKQVQKDMKDQKKVLQYYQCLYEAQELTGVDNGVPGVTIHKVSIP